MISVMLSAIMTTDGKQEWPLPFPGKKPLQTISARGTAGRLSHTTSDRGEGYIAFAEGDRLGVPVILETDAKSKCDKYVHLGMELAGVRDIGEFGKLYDLIKKPDAEKQQSVSTEASTSK